MEQAGLSADEKAFVMSELAKPLNVDDVVKHATAPEIAAQLRELLTAVAIYATGGRKALKDFSSETKSGAALRLLEQLG